VLKAIVRGTRSLIGSDVAYLISLENGKALADARGEVA
jgi:hypothetical protein